MKIQSKKTKLIQEISQDQWAWMKSQGFHTMYTVIDPTDDHLGTETIEVEPIELVDANDDLAEDIREVSAISAEEEEKQFYKDYLDDMGVKYHWNAKAETLKKLYEDNI